MRAAQDAESNARLGYLGAVGRSNSVCSAFSIMCKTLLMPASS